MDNGKIVLMGGPGSGKGTQAETLAARRRLHHISTGDVFRQHVSEGTDLGQSVADAIEGGDLVADEVVIAMIAPLIADSGDSDGYVLDGFPRTRAQAEQLSQMEKSPAVAILLEVTMGELERRLLERGQSAMQQGTKRDDDNLDTIRHRLNVYQDTSRSLIEFYENRGQLVRVDGVGDLQEVGHRIDTELNRFAAESA